MKHQVTLLVASMSIALASGASAADPSPARQAASAQPAASQATSSVTPPTGLPAAGLRQMLAGAGEPNLNKPGSRLPASRNFVYRAEGKRLVEVLQDFAASQSVPGVVADGMEGVVTANFDNRPELFLDTMVKAYGILWYYDGTALYFYPARAIQSRMFRLKGFRQAQVMNLLRSLDFGDKRYPIKYDEAQNTLFVSGPPRHVELVASAVEALDAGAAGSVVKVFPLKFASAGDRALGDAIVPGMATTLRKLYEGAAAGGSAAGRVTEELSKSVNKKVEAMSPKIAPGQFFAPPQRPTGEAASKRPVSGSEAGSVGGEAADRPHFEADEGSNAVMVYGRPDRMSEYQALIQQLDLKPVLVELEATIIEVDSDSANTLGVNWSVRGSKGSFSVDSPAAPNLPTNPFALGTVIANAGRELLARVNALQREGKARIVSKPMVLGVANRSAVMREKRVATVRVAGNLEANLFQIEAGTLLQMTPQVIDVDGIKRIKLSLYIEDGNFEVGSVDQVPIVKKTEIRTEAHVLEGESLLIGGITVESSLTSRSAVPGLSKVPVLGAVFRSREDVVTRNERMFLITPRLLPSGVPTNRQVPAAD